MSMVTEYSREILASPGKLKFPGRLLVAILALVCAWTFTSDDATASDMAVPEVAGTVLNTDGKPVANAWITDGEIYTFSDQQGNFVFDSGKVFPGSSLTISGSGYNQQQVIAPIDGDSMEVVMQSNAVRGIYFNPLLSNTQETVAAYIQIAKETEVNAVIIDIKEDYVYFDTENELFQEANMVLPILDLPWLLDQFESNGIYTIARLVVFKDSPVAQLHPEYAVRDSYTGGIWRDQSGAAWINPLSRPMWNANIDLAEEAILLGFDEVQYDYIRFPTDGDMSRADFGKITTERDRETAIESFLELSRKRLIPHGGRQSADVFGYTTVIDHDLGIGQNFSQVSETVDYISPMIYPSHWPQGSLRGIPGHPNDYPYLTVSISMDAAIAQLDGNRLQLRPWLQDFGMEGMYTYGAPEVRAQIDALSVLGIHSWMIWSPTNFFHTAAYGPDESKQPDPVLPTPVATPSYDPTSKGSSTRRQSSAAST